MSNTDQPLISTITPCYRMEKYLKLFLEELPKQTVFDNLQVVLDHNEPTKQELEWVKDFQEKYPGRLKHIVVNPVEPIGTSMNRCIREADGKYVAIWNVDDLRTPDSLEKQAEILEQNEKYGVSHGNFVIVNSFPGRKGKFVDHSIYSYKPKEFTRSMVLGPFFMWRKELCEKAGMFDEQLKSGADFDLAIRLAIHAKVGVAHGVLGYYLDEGKGASTNGDGRQPLERTLIEKRYGILDKIEKTWLNKLEQNSDYKIDKIFFNEKECDVKDFVPEYEKFLKENEKL